MSTKENETLGSHNFYAWLPSVSPISIGMGLRSPALRASEAPLRNIEEDKKNCEVTEKCYHKLLKWKESTGPQKATTK